MCRIFATEKGFGDELVHFDEAGRIVGFSRRSFGSDDYETCDVNGNWIGTAANAFGDQLVHYSSDGEFMGASFMPGEEQHDTEW